MPSSLEGIGQPNRHPMISSGLEQQNRVPFTIRCYWGGGADNLVPLEGIGAGAAKVVPLLNGVAKRS